jgi:DNA-binding NarL/FixJ family response regulator
MPPTLLIVDDHAAFRSTARALLECDGWNVVGEAGDGTSGLTAARDLKPDVVLLDVRLPDTSGIEVSRMMTAGSQGPAVVLTSTDDYAYAVARCGAVAFVPKADLSAQSLHAALAGLP